MFSLKNSGSIWENSVQCGYFSLIFIVLFRFHIIFHILLSFFMSNLCSIQMSIYLELFKKYWFLHIYTYIAKDHNSLKSCLIGQNFFLQVQEIPIKFFLFFESYHFLKTMLRKCIKTEFRGGHLGFLTVIFDWQRVLLTINSIYVNDHLYQIYCRYHKVNERCTNWLD